uniref:Uncharacterized protein n=1 Tax=Pleurotus eryngii TaxID=5323 RepID=A0A343AWQ0_PLEER|nr:hypothetical protein [Pleurotus eryngii]APT42212.1 hypothetical protein [Pleurotus eryngii]
MLEKLIAELSKPRNFIGDNSEIYKYLEEIFHLTGNPGLDILNVILILEKMQIYLIIIIMYNIIILFVNESFLENFLKKIFPLKLVNYFIKYIILFKKLNKFNILALLILLLISNWYTYYYLNFVVLNIDEIVRLYFKN